MSADHPSPSSMSSAAPSHVALPPAARSRSSYTRPAASQQPSLLDLPAALLDKVACTAEARLSLFRTCRALCDLVLGLYNLGLSLDLVAAPETEVMPFGRRSRLVAALKQSPSIKLFTDFGSLGYLDPSASHMMSNAMAAVAPGLTDVKSVYMRDVVIDTLVPSWLTLTCPEMASLELLNFVFSNLQPGPTTTIAVCGQLTRLLLTYDVEDGRNPPWPSAAFVRWQLRLLPNLQSLELRHGDDEDEPRVWDPRDQQQACRELYECCADTCTTLTELTLGKLLVQDADMETLLSIRSLERFECKGFSLQDSHAHILCTWTHLTFSSELHIATFARLPLEGLRSLQLYTARGSTAQVIACTDLGATTRAVATISRCGGVQWGVAVSAGETAQPVEDVWVCADHEGCVPILLPLLLALRTSSISFNDVTVCHELLTAISQHLASLQIEMGPPGPYTQGYRIKFTRCYFDNEAWTALLPSLPPWVQHVHLQAVRIWVNVQRLARLCSAAHRPITVHVERGDAMLGVGWEQRVQAAMAPRNDYVQLMGQ